MPTADSTIQVTITSEPPALAPVRALVERASLVVGFSPHDAGMLALAVDEALANVIKHGYSSAPGNLIEIEVQLHRDPAGITITVDDCGRTVSPHTIKSRDLADVRPGGLGVHLIQQIMDHCEWSARECGGMHLTMHRDVSSSKSTDPN